MTQYELMRMLVLNEISDDYEEPGHIRDRLTIIARQYGLPETLDVPRALIDLVGLGWAKAYNLRKEPPELLPGPPVADQAKEFYYMITEEGRVAQSSFRDWPFDDSGEPVPGWSPPLVE